MSFSQIPFLALVATAPDASHASLLTALARITPVLIPSSILAATLAFLPSNVEYYVLDDTHLTLDHAIQLLDNGAARLVSADPSRQFLHYLPRSRFVLRINSDNAAVALSEISTVDAISGVVLETNSFVEGPLRAIRAALQSSISGSKRPKDLFILSTSVEASLHQLASLKLMSRTVVGTSIIPLALLTIDAGNPGSPQPENGKLSITSLFTSALRTDRTDGLFPTIPVSVASVPSPLGLVYSSAASIAHSIVTGNATYYSRSRNGLWKKGETSGAMQTVERIRMDCDTDALEFNVVETGPNGEREGFCHIPDQVCCFGGSTGLAELESTLRARRASAPSGSYTARLFDEPALLKAKIMEEAGELCDATSKEDIAAEAADLLYFALVKCVGAGVGLKEVSAILDKRSLKITRRKGDAKSEIAKKMGLSSEQAVGVVGGAPTVAATAATNGSVAKATPVLSKEEEEASVLRCQIIDLAEVTPARRTALHKRPVLNSTDMFSVVKPIIDTVRNGGDEGLRSLVVKFDRCTAAVDPSFPLVLSSPFDPALMQLDPIVKSAIDQAYHNIKKFHQAQMDKESTTLVVETMPGVICSRFARAIDRVGLYVPGGTAILPSTALMLATPAQVAECPLIVLSTPPRADGSVSPEIVYIASLTGVHHIVRAGGAQAVAAMAYGTESVPKVDKIFGPGNQFVTAAKMAVSMDSTAATAIDMPAGPSEVLVISDKTSIAAFVASDLLSQAEHGADSQVVLLAIDLNEAELKEIESELLQQALQLTRLEIVKKSIAHSLIIKCKDLAEAMEFSNSYAPEHLILQVEKANQVVKMVTNAGSIFVGPWSPESCGDYASGTNHTLPTYGYAKQYSGVSTLSFLKHITSQELTEDGLRKLGPVVEVLANAEGLDAHKNAVSVRLRCLEKMAAN